MPVAELTDLEHALDVALKVDLVAADARDRRHSVAALGRLEAKFAALSAEVVGSYDGAKDWAGVGYASPAVGVRETARVPMASARRMVGWGRALRAMPGTQAALVSGSITTAHAGRLRNCAKRSQFADGGEAFLLEQAGLLRWADWLKAVDYWLEVTDPANDPDAPFEMTDPSPTGEFRASKTMDGIGELLGTLDKVQFEAFEEGLHRIEQELFQADWRDLVDRYGKDATASQMPAKAERMARALVEMAYRAHTAPKDGLRPLPLLVAHCDVDTLERALARVLDIDAPEPLGTEYLCELDSGTAISVDQAVRIALHGTIRRLVYNNPSHVLDYGRSVRLYKGALRQAIIHAARTCDAEGCETRASRCEIDHRQSFRNHGPTNAANGRPICRPDHKHRTRTDPG